MRQTDCDLADFDPALVDDIKSYLTKRRDKLRARARSRGGTCLPPSSRSGDIPGRWAHAAVLALPPTPRVAAVRYVSTAALSLLAPA
jgi:hypothetical protein